MTPRVTWQVTPRLRPGRITFARVLYLLGGSIGIVNGAIELGPDARPSVQAVGWPLVLSGLLAVLLAIALRTPRRWLPAAAGIVTIAMIAARVAQVAVLGSPLLLATCILPVFAAWSVLRPDGRVWAATSGDEWAEHLGRVRAQRRSAGLLRRVAGSIGVVGLVGGLLVVVGGAGVTAASLPCDLPAPAAESGLVTSTGTGGTDAAGTSTQPTGTVRATDGTRLAYYAFVPADPVASLVFYHGSGANSTAGYLGIGSTLEKQGIAVYLFDIRGHGASGGPRGDTPSTTQLVEDTVTAVSFVHQAHRTVPEFVGGHSAGAGVVLNSASAIVSRVAGYVFLAPDFGLHSGTERQDDASNFATICQRPLIAATVTNGLLGAHTQAVAFAYTAAQIRAGLIPRYTAAMAIAQNADDSAAVLASLHAPIGVWVGAKDEVFDAARVVDYARAHGGSHTTADVVSGATHLGILDNSGVMGDWIVAHAHG